MSSVSLLEVSVAALFTITVFHVLLTFGLTRRLRSLEQGPFGDEDAMVPLPVGITVSPFSVHTIDGELVHARNTRATTYAFFDTDCKACKSELPSFVDYAAHTSERVVAVVTGPGAVAGEPYVEALVKAAFVVVEPFGGELQTKFGVDAYPAFFQLDGAGRVTASTYKVAGLEPEAKTEYGKVQTGVVGAA